MNKQQIAQLNEYPAWVFEKLPTLGSYDMANRLAFGLIFELCEGGGPFDKTIFQGHELDDDKLKKECGDLTFFLSGVCHHLGIKFGDFWESTEAHGSWVNMWPSDLSEIENRTLDYLQLMICSASKILERARMAGLNKVWKDTAPMVWSMMVGDLRDLVANFKGFLNMWELDIIEIIELNQAKLNKRYPDGFTAEDSARRVDEKAWAALPAREYLEKYIKDGDNGF